MTEKKTTRFMIISGKIASKRRKEFEQTFRLASSTLGGSCLGSSLSVDIDKENYYHFFSVWLNEDSLRKFMESMEFQLISGAFHALGSVNQTMSGHVLESQIFHTD